MPKSYLEQIADYYDHSRLPCEPGAAGSLKEELARPGSWAAGMAADLRSVLAGRRVLEVACGNGRCLVVAELSCRLTYLARAGLKCLVDEQRNP